MKQPYWYYRVVGICLIILGLLLLWTGRERLGVAIELANWWEIGLVSLGALSIISIWCFFSLQEARKSPKPTKRARFLMMFLLMFFLTVILVNSFVTMEQKTEALMRLVYEITLGGSVISCGVVFIAIAIYQSRVESG